MPRFPILRIAPILLVVCALTAACAFRGRYVDGGFSGKEVSYRVGELGAAWSYKRDKASDLHFVHRPDGATLYSLSTCKGFQDAPLQVLANHLFFGFDESTVRQQKIFRLDGRDALERIVLARLDGVEVGVAVTVLKKNACVFDFSLVAPIETFDVLLEEYRLFVGGFALESDAGG